MLETFEGKTTITVESVIIVSTNAPLVLNKFEFGSDTKIFSQINVAILHLITPETKSGSSPDYKQIFKWNAIPIDY